MHRSLRTTHKDSSQAHKTFKDEPRSEMSQSHSDTTKGVEVTKRNSFMYGDQFGGHDSISPPQKRSSSETDDMYSATNYYKAPKTSANSQSNDDGSNSTCSDDDKDFSASRKPSSNKSPSSMAHQFFGYPSVPFLKATQTKRTDFNHFSHHPNHLPLSLRTDFAEQNFFNALKPPGIFGHPHDDDNNGEDGTGGIGSELLVAAYNNFVRKLVDETLDRTITFCEQPRHAISALERICSKAWPQLEAKRHRNRIRAYLKACRRNSKKNRGLINMKEPPMNGLSVEARQMVAAALNLVMKDIEQLRQDLKRDNSPSVFTAKNGTLPPNLRRPEAVFGSPTSSSNQSVQSPTARGQNLHHSSGNPLYSTPSSFSSATTTTTHSRMSKYSHDFTKSTSTTSAGFNRQSPLINSLPFPPAGLDPDCVSALMRFFPSNLGSDFRSAAAMHTAMLMNGALASSSNNSNAAKEEKIEALGRLRMPMVEGKTTRRDLPGSQPPPAAHFAVAKYSPTLNEAASMLLDVRPLSHDDIAYFQHYQEIMQDALDYARGVSQMLIKKVEILEGHFKLRRSVGGSGTALSFVNND